MKLTWRIQPYCVEIRPALAYPKWPQPTSSSSKDPS
jgi:hypothetical protein